MAELLSIPLFLPLAIIAVLVTGISKGGFGGIALLAVPLLSLVISPIQAAGIMLPIMIPMDVLSIWAHRKNWNGKLLCILIPGSIIGIIIGAITARWVNDDFVRLIVGAIAVVFSIHRWLSIRSSKKFSKLENLEKKEAESNKITGIFWGSCAGYASFLAHAGMPPYQVYVLPQNLGKKIYTGTSVIFFGTANALKLIPYGMLGQLSVTNLSISLLLLPLVPIGVFLGVWINRKLKEETFFSILLFSIFLVGLKLIWDGIFNVI